MRLAERQFGVISAEQLLACGLSEAGIRRWVANGRLHRISRGVYAVGHRALSTEGWLAAALLGAGSGAALSHGTSAWWRGLLRFPDRVIHVSRVGRAGSRAGVRVHCPARLDREWHRGLPVTGIAQTLLDIAPTASEAAFRRAVAMTDHLGIADLGEVRSDVAGHRGCRRVRGGIDNHIPALAKTLSPLEDRFILFCEGHGLPIPEPNGVIAGYHVDAVFRESRLAVELDGRETHGTPAAVVLDRRRELAIRGAGFKIVRYGDEQLESNSAATAADLRAALRSGPG